MTDANTELPTLARPPQNQPKAAREQLTVQAWEGGLLAVAHTKFPTVKWWHGYRMIEGFFGSYCYVCESFIVTWSRRWPIPKIAAEVIDEHKELHRRGVHAKPATITEIGHPQ